MEKKYYDLTNPQQSIWLTEQFYKDTSINHICGTVLLHETVNFSFLEKAIKLFVKDNDSFRIKLTFDEAGKVRQFICPFSTFPIELISLKNDEDLKLLEKEMVKSPLFLMDQFLFCFKMFQFPDGHGGFVVTAHHLISDACTAGLLASKVITIYTALLENTENLVAPTSYLSYILSEKNYLSSDKFEKDKAYWDSVFDTVPEMGVIPSVLPSTTDSCRANRQMFVMPCNQVEKIHHFCTKNKISIFNFFMAIYAIYIGRVSQLDDFVLGTPILNRTTFTEKNTPGMFISTVPFRFHVQNDSSFVDFIKQVAIDALGMFRHQKYPYQNILEHIRSQNPSAPNLYDILISYQNTRTNKNTAKVNYEVRWTFNDFVADAMQIHLFDMNDEGSLNIAYDYRLDKYSKEDIYLTHNRILYMIEQVLSLDSIFIQDIEIVTPEEKQKLLYDFNKTALCYDEHKTLVDFFEEQVSKHPNQVALVFEDQCFTYQQLNQKANQLARYLLKKGLHANQIIGILVHRSPEMIIGLLAILKIGATYLPIDPEYPIERISYILQDSCAVTLLVQSSTYSLVSGNYQKLNIDLENSIYQSLEDDNIYQKIDSHNLMYMIYTSGSTGNPKGVMITYQNITNFILAEKQYIDFSPEKTMLCVTTICFDIFALEVWCSLAFGMKIILANELEQTSPSLLRTLCLKHKVNIIQTTPSRYSMLLANEAQLDFLTNLTDILVGGEPFPEALLKKLQKFSNAHIYNMYGPTETTVWSTIKDLSHASFITIGKPIANTTCYILDKNQNLLPMQTPGELYIGGDGVTQGYWHLPSLTKEKFITSPFDHKQIIYNTNDLAYFTKEGELVHLGRSDFQVKIRGYRIELSEIENKILSYPTISDCTVLVVDNSTKLCAYYISSSEIDVINLRQELSKSLPNYMIPHYFMKMDSFPHTPNGKINRKEFPLPTIQSYKEVVYARNSIDEKLLSFIKTLLSIDYISIDDSFFDLGGDSLSAIYLSTKIENFYHISFTIRDIFNHPIFREISDIISSRIQHISQEVIEKVEKKSAYLASSAQKRIFYSSLLSGKDSIVYNMPGIFTFYRKPDMQKLEQVFNILLERHPILSSYFEIEQETLWQKIDEHFTFHIQEIHSCSSMEDVIQDFVKPFDLSCAPLFRASLVCVNNQFLLCFDVHHILLDGSSLQILLEEICKLYNDESLVPIDFQYFDYTNYMQNLLVSGKLSESKSYWLEQLQNPLPTLVLPYDKPRPTIKSYRGAKIHSCIEKSLSFKIDLLAKELQISPYMILLSVFYILLMKYSNQEDIIIGSPVVGRNREEFKNVLGMFVNTLPLRIHAKNNITFMDLLVQVKKTCLDGLSHQIYPFDEIINALNIKRDISRSPLLDVLFTYQNMGSSSICLDNFNATLFVPDTHISKFDLSLEVIPTKDTYQLIFQYCQDLFTISTIQNYAKQYIKLLGIVLEDIQISISEIDILSTSEKEKMINQHISTVKILPKVELTQIEKAILLYPPVSKVAVIYRKDSQGRNRLIAYIEAHDHISISNLRALLHKHLDASKVPSYFMVVDKIPYLYNGDISIEQLPLPTYMMVKKHDSYQAPRTALEFKIANLFQKVLHLSSISIQDSFFDLGGDSLSAMSLQIELMKLTKQITYSDIFMYTTVEELSKKIDSYITTSSTCSYTSSTTIQNALDTCLQSVPPLKKVDYKNFFLTGVTGFLGIHILENILQDSFDTKIYCLIRKEPGLTLEQKLLNKLHYYFGTTYDHFINHRIFIIDGDISKDQLGLSPETVAILSATIDCVIHSAAKISHYGNYATFKNVNVIGTQNVIAFCKNYRKKLYHISTLSVSGNAFMTSSYMEQNFSEIVTFKENNFYIGQSLDNVYVRSKFEAEKLILEGIQSGLDAYILRVGNLMPRMSDGKFQKNKEENAYFNRFSSFLKLKMIPDYLLEDYAEFTPVDYCAQAIMMLIHYPSSKNRIFHLFNHHHILISDLLSCFKNTFSLEVVSGEEFLKQIDILLELENSKEILSGILGDFDSQRHLMYNSNIHLNSDFTIQYLKNIGFEWPNITKIYLKSFLKLLLEEV